jgi:hypothetical protein
MSEDETRPHDLSGDATSADAPKPSSKGPPGDATAPQPPAGDDTVVVPKAAGPSGTGILPAVGGGESPKWSARAQVRPPSVDEDVEPDWEESAAAPGRGLLAPILISVGAVVLLALIVAAVLLLMRDSAQPVTPPTATATPPPASPTASPTPQVTTPAVTSSLVTSFGPAPVEIPALAGQSFDTAAAALRDLGLLVRRIDQSSATVPAGQVIDTEPPAGTLALPGLPVDVIVSTGPAEEPTTTTTTTTTPPN